MGRIVGITGKAGSGKSTAAKELIRLGWVNVKMAGALKDMMRAIGLTDDHIEGDLKEVPCYILSGRTPRYAMQTLGTEWGRDIMSNDLWVNIAEYRAKSWMENGFDVVVDDIRFQNEADMIRNLGGIIVGIIGRGGISSSHSSENGVNPDFSITNDNSIDRFLNDIRYILHDTNH